jgi:o-succinylbenzoate synthase
MSIIELIYAPYSLNFKKPFITSKGTIDKRKGFIINLKNSTGLIGVGDASPFPEFGSETYEQTEEALNSLKIQLKVDLDKIEGSLAENLSQFNNFPALRHGFEQALLDLISKEKNIPIAQLLRRKTKNEINVNGLIDFQSPKDSAQTALKLKTNGFRTIKIKTGRDNFDDDYKCIEAVRNAVGKELKLRVDINGKWNLDEAKKNLHSLEKFNIEYIEQPVSLLNDFIALKKFSAIPLAADESIRTKNNAFDFIINKAADVFILKPMMLGGLVPTLEIIDIAYENGVKSVITSSFESAVGKSIVILAASTIVDETAHGLNTAVYFEKDLISDKYTVENGKITI